MNFNKLVKGGLAAVMAMSMAACSSNGGSATPAGSTAAEAGAFKLGSSGPLTGDAAVYGLAVQHGAQIAIDEINAAGKVAFEFNMQDDQADGEMATSAFNTLMDWGMQVSLLTVTSGSGQAVAPLYDQENIFAITPSGSSTSVIYAKNGESDPYGNTFQMCFTDPAQGTLSATYVAEHPELGTNIAIIYRNDDNYSTGIYDKFVAQANELGLNIVDTETFVKDATDFSVQIQKCKAAGADLVFLPIYYQPSSQIFTEAAKQEYAPTFFGVDGMDGILTMEGFDPTMAEGVFVLTPFSATASDDKTQNFVKKYQAQYGEIPNQFAADAYDAVYAIAAAIEATGVTAADSTDDITEALIGQFTSMTFNGVTGKDVTWAASGEVSKAPMAVVIKNGTYTDPE